jgi:hypothetical protein
MRGTEQREGLNVEVRWIAGLGRRKPQSEGSTMRMTDEHRAFDAEALGEASDETGERLSPGVEWARGRFGREDVQCDVPAILRQMRDELSEGLGGGKELMQHKYGRMLRRRGWPNVQIVELDARYGRLQISVLAHQRDSQAVVGENMRR